MTKNCEECNKQFEGHRNAHYCPECRLKLQREAHKRYAIKTRARKTQYQRDYYYRNRERLLEKKKERNKANYEYKRGPNLEREDLASWKIEYLRKGDLWTWKATKGNVTLEAHRNFYSLRTAQKDCALALG